MSEEKKYAGESPMADFNDALRNMLLCYDALEDENIPIDEYPHYDYAKYSVERVRALHKEGKLLPVTFLHIPFMIAKGYGTEKLVSEYTRKNYRFYVELLIKQFDQDDKERIAEKIVKKNEGADKVKGDLKRHLEMYRDLKGERVFELESYNGWKGWNPNDWNMKLEGQSVPISDLEQIGREFEFSYAMARLASLCEAQKKEAPYKEKWVLYFWGLVKADEVYESNNQDAELENLKHFLKQDYKAIFSLDWESNVDYLESCIKYFNPYYLTLEEMNKYFICSIILCKENKEKPKQVFFRQVCLLGRLNKIHCYPIRFIESESESNQENLRSKIRALKEILVGNKIIFPEKEKIKSIEDDWLGKVGFLGAKYRFRVLFPMICSLFDLDYQYENRKSTGNKEQMDTNKEYVENAKSSYALLDWIAYPLESLTDRKHRIFELIISLICLYSTDPKKYNDLLNSKGENILPELKSASDEPEKRLALVKKMNEGIIPEIISFFGILERFSFPVKLDRQLGLGDLMKFKDNAEFMDNKENASVMFFRSNAVLGSIFKHPKIVKFITRVDYEKNMAWIEDFKAFIPTILPLLLYGAMKLDANKMNPELTSYCIGVLNGSSVSPSDLLQICGKLQEVAAQSGKIDLENCNPEKPIS